jgi:tRNA-(ms[2]io[6]A)-hydroxylase
MKLLAENLDDSVLAEFYQGLLASEARHNATYLTLAEEFFSSDVIRSRLSELSKVESAILAEESDMVRMHT